MNLVALDEPWDWLLSRQKDDLHSMSMNGAASPRVLAQVNAPPPTTNLQKAQMPLPMASFPFILGGSRYQAFHLPSDHRSHSGGRSTHDFQIEITFTGHTLPLKQVGVVKRLQSSPTNDSNNELSRKVSQWVDWQVRAFQELGHLPEIEDLDESFDAVTRAAVFRRTWGAARATWLKSATEEARMALIVKLSQDPFLHRALDSISRSPRRILQRYRGEASLTRIQELDSACIRDYARRPGLTAIEKAGPRQRLLAVLRREQRDTLENRVTCWVMEAAVELAREYGTANSIHSTSGRAKKVRTFGRQNLAWRQAEPLYDVAALHQNPSGPNYPLQFENRYQLIWKTYNRILREKSALDDAWAWQRVLWSETGRQLLACSLTKKWKETFISTPFYRSESRTGCWTEPPVSPGPFHTNWGQCFLLDSRDLDGPTSKPRLRWLENPPFVGANFIGATGCDQILFWPKRAVAVLIWHLYHTEIGSPGNMPSEILSRCADALRQMSQDIIRFARATVKLSGVLLIADLGRESGKSTGVVLESGPKLIGGTVNALLVPPDVANWASFPPDLATGFERMLEAAHSSI